MGSSSAYALVLGRNRIDSSGVAAPTTPSAQAAGVGNTTWSVNVGAIEAAVDGVYKRFTAVVDGAIHSGSYLVGLAIGYSCIADIVVRNVAGVLSIAYIKGTPALSGTEKPPSDAVIQAAVGAHAPWLRVGRTTIARTADTTVVQSYDTSTKAPARRTYSPSDLAVLANSIVRDALSIRGSERNKIVEGLSLAAPSTPSTQASGVGNTVWRVNISALSFVLNGVYKQIIAQADFSIHAASFLTGFANGCSCIAALVEYITVAGVVATIAVKGTPATTGLQQPPTDESISAAVLAAAGVACPWMRLGETTLNRTADTVVSQSYDNSARPILGRNVNPEFGNY